jgi:mRNA interferase RelE/StbE
LATRDVRFTRGFTRLFQRLPDEIRQATYQKLGLFVDNPAHPSLRVKRVKGTPGVWEMSITMNYRVTFEVDDERVILRAIGTHDVLRKP